MKHYIDLIQDSEVLDPETKLLALCEIDLLQQNDYTGTFDPVTDSLPLAFKWDLTENGHNFWEKIYYTLLNEEIHHNP